VIGVTPAVAVQQIGSVAQVLVVVELVLIALDDVFEHDSQQYPGTHVESGHLDEDLVLGFARLHQPRPVHFLVAGFDDAVADSEEMLIGIGSEHILALYLAGLEDGLFRLLVVLLRHDVELISRFGQRCFLVLELVGRSGILILQLFVLLHEVLMPS
jgi:hypothetical protein